MLVKQAIAVARHWVGEEAGMIDGFAGAFFHGSINWLPDDADLPPTSDIDLMIVVDGALPAIKFGKFIYQNVLLEVSYVPFDQLQSPDLILGNYRLAGSFHTRSVIADPAGQLSAIQAEVAAKYAQRFWVERRCEDARNNILHHLQHVNERDPLHDQVASWLFATGVTTHVPLVAGLKNPTVRQRYLAARTLLAEYGYADFYERLLELLGCADMDQTQATQHLHALTAAFDAAKLVIQTPIFFASDISDQARPIAIDGSRALIERGDHREAIFWIVATYSRCQKVLHADAPTTMRDQFTPGYRRLLNDLGIASFADLQRRGEQIKAFLPRLWDVAHAILAANPAIEADPDRTT